jgi:hypothetical protein
MFLNGIKKKLDYNAFIYRDKNDVQYVLCDRCKRLTTVDKGSSSVTWKLTDSSAISHSIPFHRVLFCCSRKCHNCFKTQNVENYTIPTMLIGVENEEVSFSEGQALAASYACPFVECDLSTSRLSFAKFNMEKEKIFSILSIYWLSFVLLSLIWREKERLKYSTV